ncbi:MAG: cell wall-binding repeat-containing protein [Oscillospiraceae bacterium]|nr:cell wall-binding repeat-containing protein [Oscillospiraceae bacterium]
MKRNLLGRVLALVLVLCMVVSICPVKAQAAEVESIQKLLDILEKNGLKLNESEVVSGTGTYNPTANSKYIALGDGSALGYPEKLAEELGIAYENLAKNQQTAEEQLEALEKEDTQKKIEEADLISVGFGNVTCINEAIYGVLSPNADVDWAKYVAEEDVAEIQKIIDELVVEITGSSSAKISNAMNAFAFSFVSYIYGINEIIDVIHDINSDALLLVVGMYNPLEGVVFEMAGIKLDISNSLDDLVMASNSHVAGYCESVENTVFVNAPEVATINTKTNMGLKEMAALLGNGCADFNPSDAGHTYIKDQMMDALVISEPAEPQGNVTRLYGNTRYETSFAIADEMKKVMGIEKFDAVVLANSDNFADALAGSYLAAVKKAPIIITKAKYAEMTCEYLNENLNENAYIYVLGGTTAMPGNILETLEVNATVCRLEGKDRYATNLAILDEADIGDKDLLVATGLSFADSLSASATGLPILLVNSKPGKSLTQEQKNFLKGVEGDIYILGGESAVNEEFEAEIEAVTNKRVTRIFGDGRYETSVEIAAEFLPDATSAVVAYAGDFPDGLCGGPLACIKGAPLLLTKNGKTEAPEYTAANGITTGYVLGGANLISDEMANRIFK